MLFFLDLMEKSIEKSKSVSYSIFPLWLHFISVTSLDCVDNLTVTMPV